MTLGEFIKKWNGKECDFDGKYGTQCVDLYRMYVKEVLVYPQSPLVEGAKDIWNTYLKDYFKRISNTPEGIPEEGDIIIWGEGAGKYGHVAIFLDGTTGSFNSFDANWPVGTLPHIQNHRYNNVLGWLRPIKSLDTEMTDEQKRILDFIGNRTEGDVREAFGALGDIPKLKTQITELKKSLKDADSKVTELMEYIAEQDNVVKRLGEINETLSKDVKDGKEREDLLASEIGTLRLKITDLEKIISSNQTPEDTANELEKDKNIFIKIWLLIKSLFK